MSPGPWMITYWKVRAHVLHALYENAFGRSPAAPLNTAVATIHSFAGALPDDYWFLQALIECRLIDATYTLRTGKDTVDIIEDARREIKKATEIKKNLPEELRVTAARIEVVAIRAAKARRTLRADHFARALERVEPFIHGADASPLLYAIHAEILSLRAQWAADAKTGKPAEDVAMGLASAAKALVKNPRMVQALVAKANLLVILSRIARSNAERVDAARQAKEVFSTAFRENPLLEREYAQSFQEIQAIVQ